MTHSTDTAVLLIGPKGEQHTAFAKILEESNWLAGMASRGKVMACSGEQTALQILKGARIPIVLCDGNLGWRGLLEDFRSLSDPPFLIVTSRLADDRLWSEALNLGAYDLLAQPFDRDEVIRVLNMAWIRWVERSARPLLINRPSQRTVAMFA